MIRILIYEDNQDFTESLKDLLNYSVGIDLLATFSNPKEISKHIQLYKPDLILMDIDMPILNGIDALRKIKHEGIEIPVIMLTVFEDNERVFQSICYGAAGYILKSTNPDKLVEFIKEAIHGGAPMTPTIARQVLKLFSQPFHIKDGIENLTSREHDILSLLVRGYSYKMAASELGISIDTIRFHIKNIYLKLNVNSKSEAIAKAIQNNIIRY